MYLERLTSPSDLKTCLKIQGDKDPRSFYFDQHLRVLIKYGNNEFDFYKVKTSPETNSGSSKVVLTVWETPGWHEYYVSYDEEDLNLAAEALKCRIDWSSTVLFPSMPEYQWPMLKTILKTTNANVIHEDVCYNLVLRDINKLPELPTEEQHVIKNISPDLAHVIDSNWKFNQPHTEKMIRTQLETSVGFGVFIDGEMVSWIILSKYVAVGHLHTLPEARGRGYASLLVNKLARHLHDLDLVPFAFVEVENSNSLRLFERLGFEIEGKYSFTVCAPQTDDPELGVNC